MSRTGVSDAQEGLYERQQHHVAASALKPLRVLQIDKACAVICVPEAAYINWLRMCRCMLIHESDSVCVCMCVHDVCKSESTRVLLIYVNAYKCVWIYNKSAADFCNES